VDNRTTQVRGIAQLSIEDEKSESDLHKSGKKDGDWVRPFKKAI
jgi:hypothetical protein